MIRSGPFGRGEGRGRAAAVVLLAGSLGISAARADFEAARWPYSRPIRSPRAEEGAIRFRLVADVYDKAMPDLSDLRIVDRGNQEVPYATRLEQGSPAASRLTPRLYNRTYRPGKSSSVTLDFGEKVMKGSLTIQTPGENFRREVRLEGSEDGTRWEIVEEAKLLFDVREVPGGKAFRKDQISFPPGDHRYLKVTVFNAPSDPPRVEITGVFAEQALERPPILETVPVRLVSRREDEDHHLTEIVLDAAIRNRPLHSLRFEFEDANFHRFTEVSGRDGEREMVALPVEDAPERRVEREVSWREVTADTLYRFSAGAGRDSDLEIPLHGAAFRYLRVRIYNGDDRPLTLREALVDAPVRTVLFPASASASYTLYFGNPRARRPSYDLTHFLPRLEEVRITEATLGDAEENPALGAEGRAAPWSERHPSLLWGALLVTVGCLAALIRSLARSGRPRT